MIPRLAAQAIALLTAATFAGAATAEPPPTDPPLIAAARGPLGSDNTRPFVDTLNATTEPLDSIRDANGRTALHWTVSRGFEDISALLLTRGADPNAVDARGRTPLFDAAARGRIWNLHLLILQGADVNHVANDGTTALQLAVAHGSSEIVEVLLWTGATPTESLVTQAPNAEIKALLEAYLETPTLPEPAERPVPAFVLVPLHEAAARGDFPALEALMISNAGIDIRDDQGRTPIFEAIRAAQPEVVFYLLTLGANPNALDNEGRSPLGTTMGWLGGGLNAMRLFLLVRGADPHTIRKDGHSELTYAISKENEHGAQVLIMAGADPRQTTPHGTAFEIAVNQGDQRNIDLLRQYGVDGNIRLSEDPAWLIINAARRGDLATIDEALSAGADPNTRDDRGDTALILAITKRNIPAARHLIAAGADIHLPSTADGRTPLFATMGWSYYGMDKFRQELIDAGVDLNVRHTKNGTTPLMRSLWHHPGVPTKQLVEAGADLNVRDNKGRTILTRAIAENKTETADYLRKHGATE